MSKKLLHTIIDPIFGAEEHIAVEDLDDQSSSEFVQDANGAPVEKVSPLGYNIDYASALYMVISGVIGTGIFSTPGTVLNLMGSVGATYVMWVTGYIITIFELSAYIEYFTYFPRRSGGDVAYLEQAYPRPKFLMPTMYAAVSVILSFVNSSAIAFGSYILAAAQVEATNWNSRGVGVASLTFCCLLTAYSTKLSLRLSNTLGFIKVVFVFFIVISGWVVLGGHTRVKDSHSVFKNAWEGTTTDANAITSTILKTTFTYGGTSYVFGVVGEANPRKAVKIYKYFVPGCVTIIFFLYILSITAFYAGIADIETIKKSGSTIASAYFKNVFGTKAVRALDVFIALSALGHLLAVVVSHARAIRECGRQGVLPYSHLWTTSKPWGTPLLPIFATWLVNTIVMLALPAGSAYNFTVDMGSFSSYIFKFFLILGLFLLRKERKKKGLGYEGFKVPYPILAITLLWEGFVIAMVWVPPKGTLIGPDVTFFYATYAIVTTGLLLLCVAYYFFWAKILPKIGGYQHRTKYYKQDNGVVGHTVVKVPVEEVTKWDEEHNENGVSLVESDSSEDIVNSKSSVTVLSKNITA